MAALSQRPETSKQEALFDSLAQKAALEVEASKVDASAWTRFEQTVVGMLALLALALCSYNVFMRYFIPALTPELSDEVQVYLVIWGIFLALGLVTAGDRHVKADLFVNMFSARMRRIVDVFSELLGLAFSLLLLYYGIAITYQAWDFGDVSTTTLRFPLWIFMAALPAGALLMSVRYAIRLANMFRKGA